MRSWFLTLLCAAAALLLALPARAREPLPAILLPPADDPRRGPRLEYKRSLPQCPDEETFRREVAYWVDGRDHLADASPDLVRVRFEWTPLGYRGTVEHVSAAGITTTTKVERNAEWCPMLARWVALEVSKRIPDAPPLPACPEERPCPACLRCAACAAVDRPPPCSLLPLLLRWFMDLTLGISAYGMMTSLLSADVGPAAGIAAYARGDILSLAFEFRAVLPSRTFARDPIPGTKSSYDVEFDLSQFTALVVPCVHLGYFVGCAVVQAGMFQMKSTVSESTVVSYGVGPRLGFELPFAERFAVFGFGEALFAPVRSGFAFDLPPPGFPAAPAANSQWTQSIVSGFFAAGLSVTFK